jgi:glucoamylase
MSHGTLNEIYYPTIDRPQTRDMELLFTDEETFVHEEKRDFTYDFSYLDPDAPAVRVTGTAPGGLYKVTKEFLSDPHHPVVMVSVHIEAAPEILEKLKCYALLAPHLDGGGAGNSARSINVAGSRAILAWKHHVSLAMGCDCGFSRSSCGFVGSSDGFQDLLKNRKMTWEFGQAINGNIAVMGEIQCKHVQRFTLAISLGDGHHAALAGLMQTLSTPYELHSKRFIEQWHRAASPSRLGFFSTDHGRLMRVSHDILLTHEDKTYSGAFIASASIPWGASKSDDDLGGYHLVWTRDMVQTATALLACGRIDTGRRALVYLACTQQADGGFAQNFWIDGTAYWSGIQLDEVAFPIILAWRLWKLDGLGNFEVMPFVQSAASFLCRYAPVTQQERWEENAGYSPSTLAAVIAGLVCAADLARAHGIPDLAAFLEDYADWIEAHLDDWTTTNDGVLLPDVKRHYVRINPPAPGEPFHNDSIPVGTIQIANRGPDEKSNYEAREVVDGGFLELVRYGIRRPDDPLIVDTLKVIDHVLKIETPNGTCWRRYNHDGYGQKKDGGPFDGWGQGRAWPLLGGERAHYELAAGHDVTQFITAFERFSSVGGMLPEQVWDHADMPEQGMFLGFSAGSAQPLVWAHSEYLKLLRSVADGEIFDTISVVAERYAKSAADRTFTSKVEIFRTTRILTEIPAGQTLRIGDHNGFRVVWSPDNWATVNRFDCTPVGPFFQADIPTTPTQTGTISFTMQYYDQDRWIGRNYDVKILSPAGA